MIAESASFESVATAASASQDGSLSAVKQDGRDGEIADLERRLGETEAQLRASHIARERLQADLAQARSAAAADRPELQGRASDLLQALEGARDDIALSGKPIRNTNAAQQATMKALRRDFASQARAAAAARAEVRRLQTQIIALGGDDASAPAQAAAGAAGRGTFPLPGHVTALSDLMMATEALDVTVSVIIPTLNAGDEFVWLLRKLRAQKGLSSLEIVIVDSGSVDRTLELAQAQGCTVVRLPQAEFSHSHSRNVGADAAAGELLLFMVQDAYPVGDYWLHALARALLHPRSEAERVAAVSATEYPRSDTELLYSALSEGHYKYLGCHDADHIGQLMGEDNHSIRVQGQLSDITCLIPRRLFLQYRYQGQYAEDLVLGIQLIREGHRIGMISSVRTIHSHNRSTGYYVKRVFVDTIFLAEVFPDFSVPQASSVVGIVTAGYTLQPLLQTWEPAAAPDCANAMEALITSVGCVQPPAEIPDLRGGDGFGYARLAEWIDSYSGRTGQPLSPIEVHNADQLRLMLMDQLRNIKAYATSVYEGVDAEVAENLKNAALKALAMTVGANLAFVHLNDEAAGVGDRRLGLLKPMMLAGV